ncbi:ferredoxin [Nocardioides plantarum]|uniref:Ferredoxin n=1 Tax=Nocardioides plantarum TaxID=29299 RepID=A0ABV5KAL4_9ACTN|nr:ferredoxin [Nocardioides plantarum]
MKILVDYDRCEGHGLCAEQAPAIFEIDDDGDLIYHLGDAEVPEAEVDAAHRAIAHCPVAALRNA